MVAVRCCFVLSPALSCLDVGKISTSAGRPQNWPALPPTEVLGTSCDPSETLLDLAQPYSLAGDGCEDGRWSAMDAPAMVMAVIAVSNARVVVEVA